MLIQLISDETFLFLAIHIFAIGVITGLTIMWYRMRKMKAVINELSQLLQQEYEYGIAPTEIKRQ